MKLMKRWSELKKLPRDNDGWVLVDGEPYCQVGGGATIETGAIIGAGAKIWDGAIIETGATIGDLAIIETGARIGARAIIATIQPVAGPEDA